MTYFKNIQLVEILLILFDINVKKSIYIDSVSSEFKVLLIICIWTKL